MRGKRLRIGVSAVENHFAVTQRLHVGHAGMQRIEHGDAIGQHDIDLRAHDLVHLLIFENIKFGQRRRTAQVGHHAHLAAVIGQACAKDCFGTVFKHGGLHGPVDQQALAGFPVGGVGGFNPALIQKQTVMAGQAGVAARQMKQPGHQACNRPGAFRAGNADDGNAAVMAVAAVGAEVWRFGGMGKQVVADGASDRARRALRGLQMHQQAGAGVDFDNRTALAVQRA